MGYIWGALRGCEFLLLDLEKIFGGNLDSDDLDCVEYWMNWMGFETGVYRIYSEETKSY